MESGDFVDASQAGYDVARARWAEAAREVLIEIAHDGHGTVSYKVLAERVQERTRRRSNQLIQNWIGGVLGAVARESAGRGEPILSALCVDAAGRVGAGYAAAVRANEGVAPEDANAHAARERAACYRHFGREPQDAQARQRLFAADMKDIYRRAKLEAGYNATYFLRMLAEVGPHETARHLVLSPHVSDGFTALWERGRLDLTVEALVLRPQYRSLFPDELLEAAERRLQEYGYESNQVDDDVTPGRQTGESETPEGPVEETHPTDDSPDLRTDLEHMQPFSAPPPYAALPPAVPPGWYYDPYRESVYHWWDGRQWTGWTDRNWPPG